MHVPALPKLALWGWPLSSKPGSRKRLQGSWLKTVLAKTSISSRDWFRVAVSRGWSMASRGSSFFSQEAVFEGPGSVIAFLEEGFSSSNATP